MRITLHQCKYCIIFVLVQEMAMKHECVCVLYVDVALDLLLDFPYGRRRDFSRKLISGLQLFFCAGWQVLTCWIIDDLSQLFIQTCIMYAILPMYKQGHWQCQQASSSLLGIQIFVNHSLFNLTPRQNHLASLLPQAMKCKSWLVSFTNLNSLLRTTQHSFLETSREHKKLEYAGHLMDALKIIYTFFILNKI